MLEPTVSVSGLCVRKNKNELLSSISFDIQPGTICGLLGPSGAGKTTLMRAIVGIQIPTHGNVEVLGEKAGSKNNRAKIGYVTQASSIYLDLTVAQNLKFFARISKADKQSVDRTLKIVHLYDKKNQLVATLSGGEKTRVSLAVAMLADPDLLILDEPTVGLDPLLRRDLWKLFNVLAKKGKTIVVSSHVMDEALHCEQLLLLREGKLLWDDSAEKLLKVTKKTSVEDAFVDLMKGDK
ncbi:MAG: ABC transporter ATP-binding protein [Patescibacteria group bacterium]